MMDSPELIILDVGHGNCAVLRDTNGVMVIDCAPGSTLLDTLHQLAIHEVAYVLISHADYDHIGGLVTLLANEDVKVHNIYLNPDPLKSTNIWMDLRYAVKDARKRSETKVSLEVNTGLSRELAMGQVDVEILAPTPELAMSGVGGQDLLGRRLDPNSMSVVVGIVHDCHRVAVLPGDIDQVGLDNLLEGCDDIAADILVFPHHGGESGSADGQTFAQQLCNSVKPKLVVFSIGRGRFSNPQEEVIRGVKSVAPDTHILCTQLSQKCAAEVPGSDFGHLTDLPAKGRINNKCCGGTVSIRINGKNTTYSPSRSLHREFISSESVPSPICLRVV